MFSEKELHALLDYSAEGQVLSVYLDTDPTKMNTDAIKLQLRSMLKTIDLPNDVQAVEDYVNLDYDWSAKGLAMFSDQAADVFQAYPFNVSLPDKVLVDVKPVIRPLVRILDSFTGWSVVLVDKQGARLFHFDLGELAELDLITGDEVKQTKRGGGDTMMGRKGGGNASANVENIIEKNIKEVVESAIAFFTTHHVRRIMIGGTDDNIARFKDELPKAWQSLVVGEFPMSMTAGHVEVLEQATQEAFTAQRKRNKALVEQAFTLNAKGSNGVTGLIDTLNAIHEGRVKTLLVMQYFEQKGYRCGGCGYLTTQSLEKCPFCGGKFEQIDAAVEMAVREALQKNADVKVIAENEPLVEAGSIAAILRY